MLIFDVVELGRSVDESDVNRIKNFLVTLLNDKSNEDEIRKTSVKIIKDGGVDLIEVSINPNLLETGWKEKLDIFIDALLLTKVEYKDENNRYILRLEGIDELDLEDSPYIRPLFGTGLPSFPKSFNKDSYNKLKVVFQRYQPNIKLEQVEEVYRRFNDLIFTPYCIFGVNNIGDLVCTLEVDGNIGPLGDKLDFMIKIEKMLRDIGKLLSKTETWTCNDKEYVGEYMRNDGTRVNGYFRSKKNKKRS